MKLALGLLVSTAAALSGAEKPPPLALAPCEVPGVGKARCGTYEVYEDRARLTGRKIPLKLVVLPATGVRDPAVALTFFAGGPGESVTQDAGGIAYEVGALREHRDLLLVDQRGTGGSHPLDCDLFGPPADLQSLLGDFLPAEAVRRCRGELEKDADLGLYTTSAAVDDIDEVRAALGYERLDLMGGSYGTRAALVYLRRHGGHARTATLLGVEPPSFPMPLAFPRDAQHALEGVLADCAAEEGCHAAFPELASEIRAVFARLVQGPVTVSILHPDTGDPVPVTLSRDIVAEALRYLMYQSGTASLIPAMMHAAASGDFAPLGEFALFARRTIVAGGSTGLYLSVTCAEDLPRIAPGEGERAAQGTFLGDCRLRQQREACRLWVRGAAPGDFGAPVASPVPVLLVGGEWDPVTPPSQAAEAARHLPHSRVVVVPHGGHSLEGLQGLDCVHHVMDTFVEKGSVEGLDTSCLIQVRRRPFPRSLPPSRPVALPAGAVEALAGTYRAEELGDVTLESANGRLKLTVTGRPPQLLVPVAADRFRVVGQLGTYLVFETAGGRVERAVLEQGGQPALVFTPAGGGRP